MELIGHDTSSLTALFLASRSQGQLPLARAMEELIKRYRFIGFPTNIQQIEAEKIEFRQGAYNDVGIESFNIYGDGVVINSKSSTDILDSFLEDVAEWMGSALGLKWVATHSPSRVYESRVLIKSEVKLLQALDALTPIQELIAKSVREATTIDVKFEPFGVAFAADHSLIPGLKPSTFRLERRGGLSFETNYYVSQAPMRTGDHLKLLETLENMAR